MLYHNVGMGMVQQTTMLYQMREWDGIASVDAIPDAVSGAGSATTPDRGNGVTLFTME
jgi:hypothetical protein